MSTQNWLKRHRRQVAIHSSVIAGFLVFTLFAAEPIFDRFGSMPGESRVQQLQLPRETNDILHGEVVSVTTAIIEIEGWAFVDGQGSRGSSTYIVMRSDTNTYVFDTAKRRRDDLAQQFAHLDMDDWSGYYAVIPLRKIEAGEYTIGLYITKGDIEALQYTDKTLKIGSDGANGLA